MLSHLKMGFIQPVPWVEFDQSGSVGGSGNLTKVDPTQRSPRERVAAPLGRTT